jgi:quercetin dioxygenase-like cupin family protein
MKGLVGSAVGVAVAVAVVAGIFVLPSSAQDPPIVGEPLGPRAVFADDVTLKVKIKHENGSMEVVNVDNPSRVAVVKYTIQPGAQFPWHSHAGPVVVNVTQGALTYLDGDDCSEHAYSAGQVFVDPGQGHVHTAYNRTSGVTTLVATFFAAPADGPLLIPAAPAC